MATWLSQTHPAYDTISERSEFVWDHYTGDALEKTQSAARGMSDEITRVKPDGTAVMIRPKLGKYLFRRATGESILSYRERSVITRFPMHFAKIVASFTGGLFMVEEQAEREWGVLGDHMTKGTLMYDLWHDVDGQGTNYSTMLQKEIATRLLVDHKTVHYVDPPREENGLPKIYFFDLNDVRNWLFGGNGYSEVLVTELEDMRTTLRTEDPPPPEVRYIHYTLDGWGRFKEDQGVVTLLDTEDWTFVDREGNPRMPVRETKMAMHVDIGRATAQGVNYLYNLLSDLRMTLRHGNHPKMSLPDADEQQLEQIAKMLADGWNVLNAEFDFKGPDPENAKIAYEIFKDETRDFYMTVMQQYADVAREVTPTELNQEENQGRSAFLTLFAKSVDEVENDILYLLTQIVSPNDPSQWGSAWVKRKTEFRQLSPVAKSQLLAATIKGLPLPEDIARAVAIVIVETMLGTKLELDEVDTRSSTDVQPSEPTE